MTANVIDCFLWQVFLLSTTARSTVTPPYFVGRGGAPLARRGEFKKPPFTERLVFYQVLCFCRMRLKRLAVIFDFLHFIFPNPYSDQRILILHLH